MAELCTYPGPADKIAAARQHILEAHAARLSEETGETVTTADIEAGRERLSHLARFEFDQATTGHHPLYADRDPAYPDQPTTHRGPGRGSRPRR